MAKKKQKNKTIKKQTPKQKAEALAKRVALLDGLSPATQKRLLRQMKELPPLPASTDGIRGVAYSKYKRWRSQY